MPRPRSSDAGPQASAISALVRVLAQDAATPGAPAVRALLRWLHEHADAVSVSWVPAGHVTVPATSWPPESQQGPGGGSVDGVHLAVDVDDGGVHRGVLRLEPRSGRTTQDRQRRLVEAGACLALALRDADIAGAEREWSRRLLGDRSRLADARPVLAAVRAAERRRLVSAVLATTRRPVEQLLQAVERLHGAVERGGDAAAALHTVRGSTDALLQQLRRLARGSYSTVLRAAGPAAALSEHAEDLDHPVVVTGDTSVRAGWEIESGLFWAVTAVLRHLDRWPGRSARRVRWVRGPDRLAAGIEVDARDVGAERATAIRAQLVADLAPEAQRLAALGGELSVGVGGSATTVSVWLPDSLGRRTDPAGQ